MDRSYEEQPAAQGEPQKVPAAEVSVVMPARNALPYVDAAIESILGQTFRHFEFLIRDDGSTDGTTEALRTWANRDSRIRLFEGRQLGPAASSNWVVEHSRAPLVARMDADDIARPDRLERQVALFRQVPDLALVGSLLTTIDSSGRVVRGPDLWRIARSSCFVPFGHATVMFRRAAFEAAGGYRQACEYWEDQDLFLRMSRSGRIAVIADDLLLKRETRASTRLVPDEQERVENAVARMYSCMAMASAGRSYEPLIDGTNPDGQRRIPPMALVSIASTRLWAGERPQIAGRLFGRGLLRAALPDLYAVAWAALATLSPPALRSMLRATSRVLNLAVMGRIGRGAAYEWAPNVGSRGPTFQRAAQEIPLRLRDRSPEEHAGAG